MLLATDCVVIGAGISGLRVAQLLTAQGVDVQVVEARDRVGGRLLSSPSGVDLGATWFWPNEADVVEVIDRFGLSAFPQYVAGNMMFQLPQGVQQLDGNPFAQQAGRLVGGMQSMASALAAELPEDTLRLSSPVRSVDVHDSGVVVATDSDQWQAAVVVIAVPPATAMARIEFLPVLPTDVVATARQTPVWMGEVTKVVAVYETTFWRQRGLAGSAMSHVGPLREIHDISAPDASFGALFGFGRGHIRDTEVVGQLVEIFGAEAGHPNRVEIHDWSDSPYTSPPNVADLTDYELFGSPLLGSVVGDGRLYFTSTETATDAPGHIQGALSAARRTAAAILAQTVGPPV